MTDRQVFIFSTDPGHAWLLIHEAELAAVGLTEADISPYSYRSDGMLALEEDCDAGTFLNAWREQNPEAEAVFEERHHEVNAIRTWPSYGSKSYSW